MATTYSMFPVMTRTSSGVVESVGASVSVACRVLGGSDVAESPLSTNAQGFIAAGTISALADGVQIEFYITSPIAGSALQTTGSSVDVQSLILDDTTPGDAVESVSADVYFRFTDDATMLPQPLTSVSAGNSITIPIDLQDREIQLYLISRTATDQPSDINFNDAVTTTFSQPTPPTISNAEYVGDADNEVTFYANGSTGDVSVWRSIDDEDFAVIDAAVAYNVGVYVDTDAGLDGDYAYKLTQEGVSGESNIRVAVVSGESGPTGSPPSGLSGSWNGGTLDADLTWTNNSGTGNNIIERRINPTGSWVEIASVSAATASYSDTTVVQLPSIHRTYYYRVRVTSAAGYSNEEAVYIPEE